MHHIEGKNYNNNNASKSLNRQNSSNLANPKFWFKAAISSEPYISFGMGLQTSWTPDSAPVLHLKYVQWTY